MKRGRNRFYHININGIHVPVTSMDDVTFVGSARFMLACGVPNTQYISHQSAARHTGKVKMVKAPTRLAAGTRHSKIRMGDFENILAMVNSVDTPMADGAYKKLELAVRDRYYKVHCPELKEAHSVRAEPIQVHFHLKQEQPEQRQVHIAKPTFFESIRNFFRG